MPTPSSAELNQAIEARLGTLDRRMVRAYLRAVDIIRQHLSLPGTIERVRTGEPLDVILSAEVLTKAFGPLQAEMQLTFGKAFDWSVPELPLSKKMLAEEVILFNVRSVHIERALDALDDFILKKAKQTVRDTVRQALLAGLQSGESPVDVARGLRDVIGLAPNQEGYVRTFRRLLRSKNPRQALRMEWRDKRFDATLRKNVKLDRALIERMVDAYRRKAVASHAVTISRTATLNAYRRGQRAAVEEAIARQLMRRQDVLKTWITAGDERVRKTHRPLNGETVGLDQNFSNGLDMPREYRCRCKVRYTLRRNRVRLAA